MDDEPNDRRSRFGIPEWTALALLVGGALVLLALWLLPERSALPKHPLGEVEGVVTIGGKPAADVEVVFAPDPALGTVGPRSTAYTDAQGRYRLVCEQLGQSGAMVGKHRVWVSDLRTLNNPSKPGSAPVPCRFPIEYGDLDLTPLRFEVHAGAQVCPLDLPAADEPVEKD